MKFCITIKVEVILMKIVGLTGGIASGKSLVARILERLGAVVIDADQLAREVVMPGTAPYDAIINKFGKDIVNADGTIDRKALGTIVFADSTARKHLEQITHPAIRELAENRLAEERQKGTEIVFYVAPLLIEAGIASSVDEVWIVYADEKTQLERLMMRDGIGHDDALQKIAAQMPIDEKIKFGKIIINNTGTREETEKQVMELWEALQKNMHF